MPGRQRALYETWLSDHFPRILRSGFGERHHRVYRWFEGLTPGLKPPAKIEVWPRGSGKSTTIELNIARLATTGQRRFVLYVSGTQEQADRHVQSIGYLLEQLGIERSLGKYGHSKGWRRDQLRTANQFNVAALGLDTNLRGLKLDEFRPDLIVLDDIDDREDKPAMVAKKERTISQSILPSGSTDCAVVVVQNLVHEHGVVARLVNRQSDFLRDRLEAPIEVAVRGLEIEPVIDENTGAAKFKIVQGEATWEGQSLSVCERQINEWGPRAFKREAQQEVEGEGGFVFDKNAIRYCPSSEVPRLVRLALGGDLAGTEGGGDYTALVLLGLAGNGCIYVLKVVRQQLASHNVRKLLSALCAEIWATYERPKSVRLPLDPGQAGKWQQQALKELLADYEVHIVPVTGAKAVRCRGWADKWNSGNVVLVRDEWNGEFVAEHHAFREDEQHDFDDQVDAASDAYLELLEATELGGPVTTPPANSAAYEYVPLGF